MSATGDPTTLNVVPATGGGAIEADLSYFSTSSIICTLVSVPNAFAIKNREELENDSAFGDDES